MNEKCHACEAEYPTALKRVDHLTLQCDLCGFQQPIDEIETEELVTAEGSFNV